LKKLLIATMCIILFSDQIYAQNPPCASRMIDIIDLGGWGTSYSYCGKVFLEVDSELLGVLRSVNDPQINEYLRTGSNTGCLGAFVLVGGALALGWGLAMSQGSDTENFDEEDTPAYMDSKNSLPVIIAGGAILILGAIIYGKSSGTYRKAIERYNEIVGGRVNVSYRNDTMSRESVWTLGYRGIAF